MTHSSGNHGQAVALAARLNGVVAHVVVPQTTPQCKVDAIEGYGGAQTLVSDGYDEYDRSGLSGVYATESCNMRRSGNQRPDSNML